MFVRPGELRGAEWREIDLDSEASIVRELDHVLCRFLMVDLPKIERVSLQIKRQRIQWMQHT